MLRKLLAATTTIVAAAALLLVASPALADPPADNSNNPTYWQTPGTDEVCANIDEPGGATWTLPAAEGRTWTKVVIKAGSTGTSVEAENNAYYDDVTYKYPADAPGTTWNQVGDLQSTTFSHPSEKDISHVIYCWLPPAPTEVSGSASATDQTCHEGDLVGGVITVVITTGVTYAITGPSGAVPFDPATGMTGALPPGSYTVTVTANDGYVLSGASSIPLTIDVYDQDCGEEEPIEVTPGASATDQMCVIEDLVGGTITVDIVTGISYEITGPSGVVSYDPVTGETGPVDPGEYTVTPTAADGYELTSDDPIVLTVGEYEGDCGLETLPFDLIVTSTPMTCDVDGSITLSSTATEPEVEIQTFSLVALEATGVTWTVNGVPTPEGTITVTEPGVYHVHVDPPAGHQFGEGTQTDWTFTFTRASTCDLTTLALTGSDGSASLAALAAGLGLLGASLVRIAGRQARRVA